jgi:hypothetical protein
MRHYAAKLLITLACAVGPSPLGEPRVNIAPAAVEPGPSTSVAPQSRADEVRCLMRLLKPGMERAEVVRTLRLREQPISRDLCSFFYEAYSIKPSHFLRVIYGRQWDLESATLVEVK